MSFQLSSETVAIISGASSGVGRATALALAERNVRLCLLARSEKALAEVRQAALLRGARDVFSFIGDVRDEAAMNAAVKQALERFGRIDILINNAGLSLNGEVDGYSLADWRTVVETNLTGTFLLCRAVLPTMKRQQSGQIINLSSGAGRNGIKNMAAYCAAKFGVIGFTESLGLEVRNDNIRVSVLLPGSTATNFSTVAKREAESNSSGSLSSADHHEIRYLMTAEEVAAVIVSMLAQPAQAWMSEVVLRPLNLELRRTIA